MWSATLVMMIDALDNVSGQLNRDKTVCPPVSSFTVIHSVEREPMSCYWGRQNLDCPWSTQGYISFTGGTLARL
jgi:hypothetical protein